MHTNEEIHVLKAEMQKIQTELVGLRRQRSWELPHATVVRRCVGWIGVLGLCTVPVLGWGAVDLTEFQPNTPIVSAEVNANFSGLATALDDITAVVPPVGTVIPSLLSEVHMEQQVGMNWVLADGRDVTGTAYAAVTGLTTVPDLRGLFLRSANGDRADDLGNPEGDLPVGSYQGDELSSHRHAGPGVSGIASGPNFAGHGVPTNESNNAYWSDYSGGAETRPRNATVNYYVRVD